MPARIVGVGGVLTVLHISPLEQIKVKPSEVDTLDSPLEHQYTSHHSLQEG